MAMPGISTEYLAEQIQETNRRLTEAIDALRDEAAALRSGVAELKTDLKTEVAKINTSLSWAKRIGGTVATIITASVLGVLGLAYQVGHRVAQIEGSIAGLHRTTEELRADFKEVGRRVAQIEGTIAGLQKTTEELRADFKEVGRRVAQIEGTIAGLQKTTEELRADFKARDKLITDALAETRKTSEEVKASVKGQSTDMARIQRSLDRLEKRLAEMTKPSPTPR